ncbi:hypothetical protein [Elizabethkingia anophelis]|uniref:Uncharacterized protein n=3 Tax=Elizabethkingia anophelis TaxID=1117645 RepID=A0A455ZG49_9FLAO|nr:hypothetical protein [Elizabethkingia anophelis]ATC35589.1 hypothetical protein BAZ09_004895 [Elizabethkingia anophelis R26]ATC39227.1 hypothetical protein EAAG1_004895 [Elizabethkingia anophelis Ag1]ATC42908.1 hypothetical protein CMV41_04895 [Elizabethkingia anophelis]ATC46584.1 hypothetical protein CMV40_04895 [Elizabethkingia anophelis]MCQ0432193.1 hypothetical protein [Elizabethkingia anophelis]
MLLPFSTNINNKPTYFVEKIWAGFALNQIDTSGVRLEHIDRAYYETFGDSPFDYESDFKSKLHTIRRDVHNRWKQGMLIDYFINARKKNMFRFAPRIPMISSQEIFMTRKGSDLEITISKYDSYIGGDDFYLYYDAKKILAQNDGFDNYFDFVQYFSEVIEKNGDETGNYWFNGKILHWTNLKY